MQRSLLTIALIFASAAPAAGHDFWIQPSFFEAPTGATIEVALFVGDGPEIDEVGRSPELIRRFEAMNGERRRSLGGPPRGNAPAGIAHLAEPGWTTLVYQSGHSFIELPAEKFESYLDDEGLEEISVERQRRGESLAPAHESYARYCKSLVRVGEASGAYDAEVGLPIELVAETDPSRWHDGGSLELRLVFQGAPLAGRLVKLVHLEDPGLKLLARSDLNGRVAFSPPRGGPWRAVAVHMLPASAGIEGEWESFWASLTFALTE
jgi:uncharacterized GH25 family protein